MRGMTPGAAPLALCLLAAAGPAPASPAAAGGKASWSNRSEHGIIPVETH